MRRFLFIASILMFLATIPSQAQDHAFVGNELNSLCQSANPKDVAFCRGYIIGFVRGIATAQMDSVKGMDIPAEITWQQTADIVVKYLKDHPESRHLDAGLLIFSALVEVFPPKVARSEN